MDTVQCRSHRCNARVIWARNMTTGRTAPIDAEPSEDGNIVLTEDLLGEVTYVIDPGADMPRHTNHFATCPDGERFRKGHR